MFYSNDNNELNEDSINDKRIHGPDGARARNKQPCTWCRKDRGCLSKLTHMPMQDHLEKRLEEKADLHNDLC